MIIISKKDNAKLIIHENGKIETKGNFSSIILIGLLEHELARIKAKIKIDEENKFKNNLKK